MKLLTMPRWPTGGIIPADRWHESYMTAEELKKQIAEGAELWGYTEGGNVLGVM